MSTTAATQDTQDISWTEQDVEYSMGLRSKIDELTADPANVRPLLDVLVDFTLPDDPFNVAPGRLNPYLFDFKRQCWPWNRSAFRYLDGGQIGKAAQLWAAQYLCAMALQGRCHIRIHKGVPLCNLGYALGKLENSKLQAVCWLLGVVEDTLSDPGGAPGELNNRNLLSKRNDVPPQTLREELIPNTVSFFVEQNIIPLFPEVCLDSWINWYLLDKGPQPPNAERMERVKKLLADLMDAYPRLPASDDYVCLLAGTWGAFELLSGSSK
jgi:hypothetical protein